MNLLLDTQVLLWWLNDEPDLSGAAHNAIAKGQNLVFVSAVSIWEIQIKQALGKLELPNAFQKALAPFEMLDITAAHAFTLGRLPMHHRDPFDRMLIAQAMAEGFTLVTRDEYFSAYAVSILTA